MSFESAFIEAVNRSTESSRPRQLRRDRIRAERPDRLTDAERQREIAQAFVEAQARAHEPPLSAIGSIFPGPSPEVLERLLGQHQSKHPAKNKEAMALYRRVNELQLAGQLVVIED
jgi:hypothetical protein